MTYKNSLTGKLRFKKDWFGRLVVQVEYKPLHGCCGNEKVWCNADAEAMALVILLQESKNKKKSKKPIK